MYGAASVAQTRQGIPVQQSRNQQQQQPGLLKSSLDIVWSYSRSQAFYGSNLDCSPSFISRYRRPGDNEEDENNDDGDDGQDGDEEDEDDEGEGEEEDDDDNIDAAAVRRDANDLEGAAANGAGMKARPSTGKQRSRSSSNNNINNNKGKNSSKKQKSVSAQIPRGRRRLLQGTSHDSSLADTTEEDDEEIRAAADGADEVDDERAAAKGHWVPGFDSGSIDNDRYASSGQSRRRDSSADQDPPNVGPSRAAATFDTRLPRNADKTNARFQAVTKKPTGVAPAGSHAAHADRIFNSTAYAQSVAAENSALSGTDSTGTDRSSLRAPLHGYGAHEYRQTSDERSPLLEKHDGVHPNGLGGSLGVENEALYGSSPPESVPFPRKTTSLRQRRRSSGRLTKRRRSSAAFINPQGSSTSGQTLFNAINVLIGIGILALPLAFSQAGWVLGTLLLLFCSTLTNYTAKILARALYDDPRLMTYADIGAKAFGAPARSFINILFCLEISALCVALIILLGDSLSIIFPLKPVYFKLIGFAVMFPTLFLPLRYLSVASLIGIISVITLTITVFIDGLLSHSQPGSLHDPMPTAVGPDWRLLPIAFGLIMSGYGGHAVFPSLARDIKNPAHFNTVCNVAFLVATTFYLFMGIVGYLMFGNTVSDEITRDLLNTPTLPRKLNLIAVAMVAITPVCKYAISSTPLEGTISWILGVDGTPARVRMKSGSSFKSSTFSQTTYSAYSDDMLTPTAHTPEANQSTISAAFSAISQPLIDIKPQSKAYVRLIVKLVTSLVLLAIAIFIPSFDRVMGLLGAFSVFMICAIGPLAANLALYRKTMSIYTFFLNWLLLAVSVIMAVVGTVFVFIPQRPRS